MVRCRLRLIAIMVGGAAAALVGAACTLTTGEHALSMPAATASDLPATHVAGPFVIHHELDAEVAAAHGQMLLHARANFDARMTQSGFALTPAQGPLPWLLFADAETFAEHQSADGRTEHGYSAGGYYASGTNTVAVFQGDTPASRARLLHEATHQLAFNSGLQRRDVAYPFWFAEGLATNFEASAAPVDQPLGAFGPGDANPRRELALRFAIRHGRLMPLDRFVAMDQPTETDPQQRSILYAQAWALFAYLFEERREAMHGYIEAMNHRRPGRPTPGEHRERFVAAFGDPAAVAAGWRRWVVDNL